MNLEVILFSGLRRVLKVSEMWKFSNTELSEIYFSLLYDKKIYENKNKKILIKNFKRKNFLLKYISIPL